MEFVAHVDETGKPWYVKFEFLGSAQNLNYLCLIFDFRRRNKKKMILDKERRQTK